MFACAITHQSHLMQSGCSLGAVRGVQWTFSIHSPYLLKSQSENKKFSYSVWIYIYALDLSQFTCKCAIIINLQRTPKLSFCPLLMTLLNVEVEVWSTGLHLGVTSKPNHRLTHGSVRFPGGCYCLKQYNQMEPDGTAGGFEVFPYFLMNPWSKQL